MFDEKSKTAWALYTAVFLTFLGYTGAYTYLEPLHNQFFPFAPEALRSWRNDRKGAIPVPGPTMIIGVSPLGGGRNALLV